MITDGWAQVLDDSLQQYQGHAHQLVDDRWPADRTGPRWRELERRLLALTEEVGELARCVVKLDGSHDGYRADVDWLEQASVELGQVGFVLASIAEELDVPFGACLLAAMRDVEAKPTAAERMAR